MRNDWGDKEAARSARQLYERPEALSLEEACFEMLRDWVSLDSPLRWPESFGLVRRALEAYDKDRYWDVYWRAQDKMQQERERIESPACERCGSSEVVALIGHEDYLCSPCLHGQVGTSNDRTDTD